MEPDPNLRDEMDGIARFVLSQEIHHSAVHVVEWRDTRNPNSLDKSGTRDPESEITPPDRFESR